MTPLYAHIIFPINIICRVGIKGYKTNLKYLIVAEKTAPGDAPVHS